MEFLRLLYLKHESYLSVVEFSEFRGLSAAQSLTWFPSDKFDRHVRQGVGLRLRCQLSVSEHDLVTYVRVGVWFWPKL